MRQLCLALHVVCTQCDCNCLFYMHGCKNGVCCNRCCGHPCCKQHFSCHVHGKCNSDEFSGGAVEHPRPCASPLQCWDVFGDCYKCTSSWYCNTLFNITIMSLLDAMRVMARQLILTMAVRQLCQGIACYKYQPFCKMLPSGNVLLCDVASAGCSSLSPSTLTSWCSSSSRMGVHSCTQLM